MQTQSSVMNLLEQNPIIKTTLQGLTETAVKLVRTMGYRDARKLVNKLRNTYEMLTWIWFEDMNYLLGDFDSQVDAAKAGWEVNQ